ncbi:MAG: TIGR00730 family Rossman fold protein [Proteobacteria bacterium]|nr:TIGR00730 family Rossman fold protein [Pseudomonadota bacterium]
MMNPIDKTAVRADIDRLLDDVVPDVNDHDRRHMQQLLFTAVLAAHDRPDTLNLKIMNRALRELRKGFKAFQPWSDKQKIAVFGSARSEKQSVEYKMAVECSRGLVKAGYMVVTGAGPGIMEAANEGAGRENSFGVNIELPFEQQANPFIDGDPKLVNFKYFFTRKVVFVKETDGVVLFPGGFGTQDEGFETLTLVQTGKSEPRPIVMVEPPGSTYWKDWDAYVKTSLLDRGLISEKDLNLYTIVETSEEAIAHVTHFYRNFHSIRYIDGRLVIRVKVEPSKFLVDALNDRFKDVLKSGEIERCEVHPYEADEPDVSELHRLRLHFDQKNLGRLRQMIDLLNDAVTPAQAATSPHVQPVRLISPAGEPGNGDDVD